jgi:L,D-transpeptidase YcbB
MSQHCLRAVLLAATLAVPIPAFAQQNTQSAAAELLRTRLEITGSPPRIIADGELILASGALPRFYDRRRHRLAWSDSLAPFPAADTLLAVIRGAHAEGLQPADYHEAAIERALARVRADSASGGPRLMPLVELDMLLTDAFLLLAAHFSGGKVSPTAVDIEWHALSPDLDLVATLEQALRDDRVGPALRDLLPPQPEYARLREALARYRGYVAGVEWPVLPPVLRIRPGDHGELVALLRTRLIATKDLGGWHRHEEPRYDEAVEAAVRRFQARHGLEETGTADMETLDALNVSAAQRLRQIAVAMERWRWLPHDLGERHVMVNLANFRMDLVEDGEVMLSMRAVVGAPYRRTPVFSGTMTHLVFNPHWNVPRSLAVEEVLQRAREDRDYLTRERIRVFQGAGSAQRELDPRQIDWVAVPDDRMPYSFRQDPGPWNNLGQVKFMFPNEFHVYLHDTPVRDRFERMDRAFSAGCIRLENPLELAEHLLSDDRWTRRRIDQVLARGTEATVHLRRPLPVHLLYWTAWVDESGAIHFRRDVYERDDRVADGLLTPPPTRLAPADPTLSGGPLF